MTPAKITLLLLLTLAPLGLGQETARPNSVPGLSLDEPRKVTKPGYAKITAAVTAKEGAKVKILWDVVATFDDEVEFEWEERGDGRSVGVTIPDSKGVILITAWAVVDGEPTSKRAARTAVEVDYQPRKAKESPKAAPAPAVPPTAQAQRAPVAKNGAKVAAIYFVVDSTADVNVSTLLTSVGFKNRLRAAGIAAELLTPTAPRVGELGLSPFVKDAGGAPCAIFVTDKKEVRKALKLTASMSADDILKYAE